MKAQKRARTNKHPVSVLYRNFNGDIGPDDDTLTESEIGHKLAVALAPKVIFWR